MELIKRILQLEDKQAINDLLHSYLASADRKDTAAMADHFTANGTLTSIMDEGTMVLKGTRRISKGFAQILETINTTYHMAGQSKISLNGNEATGTSYCFVTLICVENNQ